MWIFDSQQMRGDAELWKKAMQVLTSRGGFDNYRYIKQWAENIIGKNSIYKGLSK